MKIHLTCFALLICSVSLIAQVSMTGVSVTGIESNPRQFILNTGPVAVWDTVYGVQVANTNAIGLVDLSFHGNDLGAVVTNAPYFFSSATTNNVPCLSFTQALLSNVMYTNVGIAKYFTAKAPWTFITLNSAHTNANSVLWQANWSAGTNGNGGRYDFRPSSTTLSQSAFGIAANTNQAVPFATVTGSGTDRWFYSTCRFDGTVGDVWLNETKGNSITSPAALTTDRFIIGMGQNAGATTFNMRWNGYWRLGVLWPRALSDAEVMSIVSNCNIRVQKCY